MMGQPEQEWQPVVLVSPLKTCGRCSYLVRATLQKVIGQKIRVAVKSERDIFWGEDIHQVHPEDDVRMSEIAGTEPGCGPVYICEHIFVTD